MVVTARLHFGGSWECSEGCVRMPARTRARTHASCTLLYHREIRRSHLFAARSAGDTSRRASLHCDSSALHRITAGITEPLNPNHFGMSFSDRAGGRNGYRRRLPDGPARRGVPRGTSRGMRCAKRRDDSARPAFASSGRVWPLDLRRTRRHSMLRGGFTHTHARAHTHICAGCRVQAVQPAAMLDRECDGALRVRNPRIHLARPAARMIESLVQLYVKSGRLPLGT